MGGRRGDSGSEGGLVSPSSVPLTVTADALNEFLMTFDALHRLPGSLVVEQAGGNDIELLRTFVNEPVLLREVLGEISPEWFGSLDSEAGVAGMADVLDQFLSRDLTDVVSAVKNGLDREPSSPRCALLLGEVTIVAAVQSENQETFIGRILALSERTQLNIQQVIQRHVGESTDWDEDSDMGALGSVDEIGMVERRMSMFSRLASRMHQGGTSDARSVGGGGGLKDLSQFYEPSNSSVSSTSATDGPKIPPLKLDKLGGGGDKQKRAGVSKRLIAAAASPGPDSRAAADEARSLKEKIRELKHELHQALSEKEDIATSLELAERRIAEQRDAEEKRINEFRGQNEEKQALMIETVEKLEKEIGDSRAAKENAEKERREAEKRHQQELRERLDEMDILNATAGKVPMLELRIDKYKAKIDELQQLRSRNELLEKQVEEYIKKVLEVEEANKNVMDLRKTIESYKQKVVELESSLSTERGEKEDLAKHVSSLKQQFSVSEQKREIQEKKIVALSAELEEERAARSEALSRPVAAAGGDLETKEKVARLTRENEILRTNKTVADPKLASRVAELENELDDMKRLKSQIEKSLHAATAKVALLAAQLESQTAGADDEEIRKENIRLARIEEKYNELNGLMGEVYKSKDELNERLMEEREKNLKLQAEVSAVGGGQQQIPPEALAAVQQKEIELERDKLALQSKVANLEMQLERSQTTLSQEKEKSELKEEALRNRMESDHANMMGTLKEQLQIRERELSFYLITRRSQMKTQRREQQLMANAFHELGCRFFNERAEKEKVKEEFEALMLKVQQRKERKNSSVGA